MVNKGSPADSLMVNSRASVNLASTMIALNAIARSRSLPMRSRDLEDMETTSTGEIDLSRIGRVLVRKRRWVIGPTVAAMLGAVIFVNVVTPRYSAEVRLLLENQENFLKRSDKGEHTDSLAPDAEAVQSQILLLTSRDLARRAIKTLELQGNDEFDPLAKGFGLPSRALALFGLGRDLTRMTPEERILESFAERLAVLSPTKTRVLSIEFTSRDSDLTARAANTVAGAYIEMQQDAKRDNARVAAQSLGVLVNDLKTRISDAEERVEAFRVKQGLLVGSNNTTISAQHLGDLNNQLSLSRTVHADAQAKAKVLRDMLRQNRIGDIPDVANNALIRNISERRVSLRAQLALELRTLLPGHPRIKELQAQLADLDHEWRTAAESTARTLENEARIAGSRVENLTRALDEQKKVAGAASADEVRLHELERAGRSLKEQLESATAKYQEALARESAKATPADARIIQRALAPQLPSFPKKVPITAFVTLAGLMLSAGAIISGELLSGRASPRARPAWSEFEPAETDDAQPTLAEAAPAPLAATTDDSQGAARKAAPCVKALVANCDGPAQAFDAAVAVSRGLSRQGRAILVAADAGDEAYHQLLPPGAGRLKGLTDFIAGEAEFAQIIDRDAESRLHVIPAGRVIPAGLGGDAPWGEMSSVVDALAQTYDFVVFATSSRDSALALAALFDVALVSGADAAARELHDELARAGADAHLLEAPDAASGLAAA